MRRFVVLGTLIVILFALYLLLGLAKDRLTAFPSPLPQQASPSPFTLSPSPSSHIGPPPPFPLSLPQGYAIGVFAQNLSNARDLEFSPDGMLLVSLPNQGKIVALPDKNQDGVADETFEILRGLNRPHGLAFRNNYLFVAELDQVVRYKWNESTLEAKQDKVLFSLPYNGGHNTRSLVFNKKGELFVTIGPSCNACEEKHDWLASVITSDKDGNNPRVFAKGLRNSVFLTVNPATDEIWAADMGRDYLGENLPPEEINIIRDGGDYGWPICWGKQIHDTDFDKNQYVRDPCIDTEPPIFEFQAHSAPLGITFIQSSQFPSDWQGDLLVAYHGSWNRSQPTGYKVVRMDVEGNSIKGAEDFITGFLPQDVTNGPASAYGRPVDIIFDSQGNLYISDDKAGMVYKIIVK